MYADGDIGKETYRADRAATIEKLAALPGTEEPVNADVTERLLSFLTSLPTAWAVATVEEPQPYR